MPPTPPSVHIPVVALPPVVPPKPVDVPPWHNAVMAGPIPTVGKAITLIVLEEIAVPQLPPDVVRVNVAVPAYPAGGVQAAFKISVSEGLNVPPAEEVHDPPVAPPPTEPPNEAEVPLMQMGSSEAPALAVGKALTDTSLVAVCVVQPAEATV